MNYQSLKPWRHMWQNRNPQQRKALSMDLPKSQIMEQGQGYLVTPKQEDQLGECPDLCHPQVISKFIKVSGENIWSSSNSV